MLTDEIRKSPFLQDIANNVWDDPEWAARTLYGSELWWKQIEIAESVRDNRKTSVRSCNGVGKTFLASALATNFIVHKALRGERANVVITGASWQGLKDALMPTVRSNISKLRDRIPNVFNAPNVMGWDPIEDLDAHLLCFSTNDYQKAQGKHNDSVFVIVDEASALEPEMAGALEGIIVRAHDRILLIGNPMEPSGVFYDSHTSDAWSETNPTGWKTFSISAEENPNYVNKKAVIAGLASYEWIEERKKKWEHDPVQLLPRIYGEFPDESDFTCISRAMIVSSMDQNRKPDGRVGPMVMGVDISWGGADAVSFWVRDDAQVYYKQEIYGMKEPQIIAEVRRMKEEWGCEKVFIDSTGNPSVVHMLEADPETAEWTVGVMFSKRAHDDRHYANWRAEFYCTLAKRLHTGFYIPPEYAKDLIPEAGILKVNMNGRIGIESKKDFIKRIGRSPDNMDAIALSFARETGDPAFKTVSKKQHQIHVEPVVKWDEWSRAYMLSLAEIEGTHRPGELMRTMWAGRNGESVCIWVHVDEDGDWVVFDALRARSTLSHFARMVYDKSKGHEYIYDFITGEDHEELADEFALALDQAAEDLGGEAAYPEWVSPGEVRGKAGADVLDRMHLAVLADFPDDDYWRTSMAKPEDYQHDGRILYWPGFVLTAVEHARYAEAGGKADRTERARERLIGGGGPVIKALRTLCAETSGVIV